MSIILGSASPRRSELLALMGLTFTIAVKETQEDYPSHLSTQEIAIYIAEKKAQAFIEESFDNAIITADTIVAVDNSILGKPKDELEASNMLQQLSNQAHQVITGVTLLQHGKIYSFFDSTKVFFRNLHTKEIEFYIKNYQPFDKAGAYGIQE